MALSNYPNGFNTGVLIRELQVTNSDPRKNLYVGNNATPLQGEKGASDTLNGGTFLRPFSTLDYAVGQAKSGDTIWVRPGHTTTVIAAGGLDLDVAGITIAFLGNGATRGIITFTTDVGADMDVDAANITLIAPRFVAGIDALTGPIDVNAANFKMFNAEFYDGTSINTTDAIVTASGATGLVIDGYRFIDGDAGGTQKESHIQLNGCDNIILRNIDIRGDFDVGCIENVTDEVLNARFENWKLENTKSGGDPALFLDANATGFCKNVALHVAAGTTYANSFAKMSWDYASQGFSGVSAPAGDALGTAPATETIAVSVDEVTQDILDIAGGPILITNIVGIVDVPIGANATTAKLIIDRDDGAADTDLTTAVNIEGDVLGTVYIFTDVAVPVLTPLVPGAVGSNTLMSPWFVPEGMLEQTMSDDPGGAAGDHITWYITYRPLVTGVTVTAQ